jgi:hypothetical protein
MMRGERGSAREQRAAAAAADVRGARRRRTPTATPRHETTTPMRPPLSSPPHTHADTLASAAPSEPFSRADTHAHTNPHSRRHTLSLFPSLFRPACVSAGKKQGRHLLAVPLDRRVRVGQKPREVDTPLFARLGKRDRERENRERESKATAQTHTHAPVLSRLPPAAHCALCGSGHDGGRVHQR